MSPAGESGLAQERVVRLRRGRQHALAPEAGLEGSERACRCLRMGFVRHEGEHQHRDHGDRDDRPEHDRRGRDLLGGVRNGCRKPAGVGDVVRHSRRLCQLERQLTRAKRSIEKKTTDTPSILLVPSRWLEDGDPGHAAKLFPPEAGKAARPRAAPDRHAGNRQAPRRAIPCAGEGLRAPRLRERRDPRRLARPETRRSCAPSWPGCRTGARGVVITWPRRGGRAVG